MYSTPRPVFAVPRVAKKQVLFLTPKSAVPYAPLPLTPVPETPRSSPTESDVSLPSSASSTASSTESYDSYGPSTPPIPVVESEYYSPEPPQSVIPAQIPSIHFVLSRPSFDFAQPLSTLLSQISLEHLNQPATSPPISRLFITCPLLPWYTHITPGASPDFPATTSHSGVLPSTPTTINTWPQLPPFQYSASPPTFDASISPADDDEYYLPPDATDAFITIHDIITALHTSLHSPVRLAEYNGFSQLVKDGIGRSYHSRVAKLDERGVRKANKKGALRMDVLPLGFTRVVGFFVTRWDPDTSEAVWGIEFGLSL